MIITINVIATASAERRLIELVLAV